MNALRRRRLGGGPPYPNMAASFAAASTQYGTIADNAALSMGAGVKMGFAGWVNLVSIATNRTLIAKGDLVTAGTHEYAVYAVVTTGIATFRVSNGAALTTVSASTFGNLSMATWYFVAAWSDGTNLNISVNNGTVDQTAFSADIQDGTNAFRLGAQSGATSLMNGLMDSAGVWKRALTAAEVTQLYKGGIGMAYRDLTTGLKTGLAAWYNQDSDLNDSHGTNHLVNTNGVTFVAGKR